LRRRLLASDLGSAQREPKSLIHQRRLAARPLLNVLLDKEVVQ